MNLSLGELQSLVAKAFRGAGYPWGLTEDVAFAARRLGEQGLPVAEMAVRLLRHVDGSETGDLMPNSDWQGSGSALCPICVGVVISDQSGCDELCLDAVFEPAFLAPFLASTLSASGGGYVIAWDDGSCQVSPASTQMFGELPRGSAEVRITRTDDVAAGSERHSRVELDDATFEALAGYAHRVYAPATEASRLAGAGAGTTDND